MADNRSRSIRDMLADNDLIDSALKQASREAMLLHARAGRAVPVCPNGQIVWLSPEQVLALFPDQNSPSAKSA